MAWKSGADRPDLEVDERQVNPAQLVDVSGGGGV
jgi:hypothetical protein